MGGAPLRSQERTRLASKAGISGTRNPVTAFAIVRAEFHEAAARLLENHPHFALLSGEGVEIMECLPMPGA